MKIFVKTKPGAKKELIRKIDEAHFEVWIKEPAREGRANKALREAMAEYFKVPKSSIFIIKGEKSREKILEINTRAIKFVK